MARTPDPATRYRRAYTAGRNGSSMPAGLSDLADTDPKIDDAFSAGQHGESWESVMSSLGLGTSSSSSTPKRSVASATASTGASIILGAVSLALVLSIVDYGVKGPLYWFKAKFLNEPVGGSSDGSSSTSSSTPSSPAQLHLVSA
jgi:hypothetical protein